jgi:hypothetical protein
MRVRSAFLFIVCSFSVLWAFHHPEIRWETVETRHFVIHFSESTEPAVYAAWKVAEETWERLSDLYPDFPSSAKIHLALADYDDYSNGSASWTHRGIIVWLPDARFELRGNTAWLRNVVAHELAHIMSMDKARGMQMLNWSLTAGYQSSRHAVQLHEPIPTTTFLPMWFIEGASQLGSDRVDGDCWDARRDMALRCAVLEGTQLSLAEMGHFTHDAVGNEMVYNQGYSLTAFLERIAGEKAVARIWREARGKRLFGKKFDKLLLRHANCTAGELYSRWIDSLQHSYRARIPEKPTPVDAIWDKGSFNHQPKASADGAYWGWLTSHGGDYRRTDLLIAPYGKTEPVARISYARTAWSFDVEGKRVFYIKSRRPNENGSYLNDLFVLDLASGEHQRLTRSARLYDIAAAPDGKSLACVRYNRGRFSLERFDLASKQFAVIDSGRLGEPFWAPIFSPQSSDSLVVTRLRGATAGLYLVDIREHSVQPLRVTGAQEERPFWGADGRIYYSADYSGAFEIYSILPNGEDLRRHTRSIGGAFEPWLAKDATLMISQYTADGFRIATLPASGEPVEAADSLRCALDSLPRPAGVVRIKAKPYTPKLLRPVWEGISALNIYDPYDSIPALARDGRLDEMLHYSMIEASAGLALFRSDALYKKANYLGAVGNIIAAPQAAITADTLDDGYAARQRARTARVQRYAQPRGPLMRNRPEVISRALAGHHGLSSGPYLQADSSITYDTTVGVRALPLLIPFAGWENRTKAPAFGLDIQAALLMVIPYAINVSPYMEHQVSRNGFWGVSLLLELYPTMLLSGNVQQALFGSLPLWIYWSREGRINEDITYNYNGVTAVRGYCSPQVHPVWDKAAVADTLLGDSVYTVQPGILVGATATHGFPVISRYVSLRLSADLSFLGFADKEVDQRFILGGREKWYVESANSARLIFPVIRNINAGRNYLDNVYGSVGYQHSVYGNGAFLRNFDFADTQSVRTVGLITASLELGVIKSYLFASRIALSAGWEPEADEVYFTLTVSP